ATSQFFESRDTPATTPSSVASTRPTATSRIVFHTPVRNASSRVWFAEKSVHHWWLIAKPARVSRKPNPRSSRSARSRRYRRISATRTPKATCVSSRRVRRRCQKPGARLGIAMIDMVPGLPDSHGSHRGRRRALDVACLAHGRRVQDAPVAPRCVQGYSARTAARHDVPLVHLIVVSHLAQPFLQCRVWHAPPVVGCGFALVLHPEQARDIDASRVRDLLLDVLAGDV